MSVTEVITGHYSYGSVDEGDNYFMARLGAEDWETAEDTIKRKALVTATAMIDYLRYKGSKTTSTQPLEFPRFSETTVPVPVMQATFEVAKALIAGADPEIIYRNISLQSTSYANIRSAYKERAEEYQISGIVSVTAYRLLSPYIRDPRELKII